MRQSKKSWIRKIDFIFFNEAEIRLLVADARNNLKVPIIRNASQIPDPTAKEAIANLTPIKSITLKGKELNRPEEWLKVIDTSYSWAKEQDNPRYVVAKLKYMGEDYRLICAKCHISIKYQYLLIERFRMFAADEAYELGLIDKEEHKEIFS